MVKFALGSLAILLLVTIRSPTSTTLGITYCFLYLICTRCQWPGFRNLPM